MPEETKTEDLKPTCLDTLKAKQKSLKGWFRKQAMPEKGAE